VTQSIKVLSIFLLRC